MERFKKVFLLFSVAILTSSLSGAEKLTVLARGGSHVNVLKVAIKEFQKEHDVKIKVLGLENADLKQKISLDSKNKEGAYDLVMLDDPWMPEFIEAKLLLNLSKNGYKEDNDFITKSLDIGKFPYAKGDIYALPFAGNVQFMFYNKSLLKELGGKVPTNWDDVLILSQKVKKQEKLGYIVRAQQGNPIVSDFLPLLWAYGGDVLNDTHTKSTINSEIALKALNRYIELMDTGANYKKSDLVASVSKGKALISLGWPSWYISDGDSQAGYAPIPSKVSINSKEYATGMIGNWMLGVTANSQHKEIAQKFLIVATSAKVQKMAMDKGAVPTRKSVTNDQEILKKYPYLKTLEDATNNSVVRARTPLWGEVEKALGIELSGAITKTLTPKEALKNAQIAIDKIVGK